MLGRRAWPVGRLATRYGTVSTPTSTEPSSRAGQTDETEVRPRKFAAAGPGVSL